MPNLQLDVLGCGPGGGESEQENALGCPAQQGRTEYRLNWFILSLISCRRPKGQTIRSRSFIILVFHLTKLTLSTGTALIVFADWYNFSGRQLEIAKELLAKKPGLVAAKASRKYCTSRELLFLCGPSKFFTIIKKNLRVRNKALKFCWGARGAEALEPKLFNKAGAMISYFGLEPK